MAVSAQQRVMSIPGFCGQAVTQGKFPSICSSSAVHSRAGAWVPQCSRTLLPSVTLKFNSIVKGGRERSTLDIAVYLANTIYQKVGTQINGNLFLLLLMDFISYKRLESKLLYQLLPHACTYGTQSAT